ncbi:MAG: hypothetical protein ACXAEN_20740, partial [Candidatus Thorarchaeota archaeon]
HYATGANHYIEFDYMRITDSTGIAVIFDDEAGWDISGCTVDTEDYLTLTTPAGAWSVKYVLSEPVPVDEYQTLVVYYSLSEDVVTLPSVSINSTHTTDSLDYLLIADGAVHVLYLDLLDKFGTGGTFDTLWFGSSTGGYDLNIRAMQVVKRTDNLSKVSNTDNSYTSVITDESHIMIRTYTAGSPDDGSGVEQSTDVIASQAQYLRVTYSTIYPADVYLDVYAVAGGTKYTYRLEDSYDTRTVLISLADMLGAISEDVKITKIGATLNWTSATDVNVWASIDTLSLLHTPMLSYDILESFSGEGLTFETSTDTLYIISNEYIDDYVDNNVSDIDASEDKGTHSNFNNMMQASGHDTLTEEFTGLLDLDTHAWNDVDTNVTDVDSSANLGIQTNFGNAQGTSTDSSYMIISEENTGGSGVNGFWEYANDDSEESITYSSYTEIYGLDFTAPAQGDYLIMVSFEVATKSRSYSVFWRSQLDDTTTFMEGALEGTNSGSANDYKTMSSLYLAEGLSSGSHYIDIDMYRENSITPVVRYKQIVVMRLDDWMPTSGMYDYSAAESQTSFNQNNVFNTLTTLTVTPDQSGDYLVLASLEMDCSNTGDSIAARINYDSGSEYLPIVNNGGSGLNYITFESRDASDYRSLTWGGIVALSSSKDFVLEAGRSGGTSTAYVRRARLFAVRLGAMDSAYESTEDTSVSSTTSNWADKSTLSFTPSSTCDYFVFGSMVVRPSSTTSPGQIRLEQTAGTATGTISHGIYDSKDTGNPADHFPMTAFSVKSLAGSTQQIFKTQYGTTASSTTYGRGSFIVAIRKPTKSPDNYTIDQEFKWTTATYNTDNANLSIYIGTHTGGTTKEDLKVQYYNSDWQDIGSIAGTVANGWANLTITNDTIDYLTSSDFVIRLIGNNESSDTDQDIWNIDLITIDSWNDTVYNYELDLEVQFTGVNSATYAAELCILTDTLGSEDIDVQIWNGSWNTIMSGLNASEWNNATITSYIGLSVTIRFIDTVTSSDSTQDNWNITSSVISTCAETVPDVSICQEAELTTWTTEGLNATIVSHSGITYGKFNSSTNIAGWNITDINGNDRQLMIRWRYTAPETPPAQSFNLTIEHDGTNSTIDLLGTSGTAGTSDWIVKTISLDSYDIVSALYLSSDNGVIHVDYIGITDGGFSTTGLLTPTSWSGDLTIVPFGYNVSDSSSVILKYSKVDIKVTDDLYLKVRLCLEGVNDLDVKFYGMDGISTANVSHDVTGVSSGWTEIELNISEIVGSDLEIITDVEVHASGTTVTVGVDYLSVRQLEVLDTETGSDYIEMGEDYGITLYELDAFQQHTNGISLSTDNMTALVNMFVGYANFTDSGASVDSVQYLEDGVPYALTYEPTFMFRVSTDGHSLNLFVEAGDISFMIGENESTVILDTMNMTSLSKDRIVFVMSGWYNGLSINRTYTVTSSGMINWTTSYGNGISIESVSVWDYRDDLPLLVEHINSLEDTGDIPDYSGSISNAPYSLSEGHGAVSVSSNTDVVLVDNTEYDELTNAHLTVEAHGVGTEFSIGFILENGTIEYILSPDGDVYFNTTEDISEDEIVEIFFSVLDLDGGLGDVEVQGICFNVTSNTGYVYIDDLYVSDYTKNVLSSQMWLAYKVSNDDYIYLDEEDQLSDAQGVGVGKSAPFYGFIVY